MAEKIRQCEDAGDDFETTKEKVLDYHNHLHTLFCLESMNNLARNGRVNIAVAKEKVRFFYPKDLSWQAKVPAHC
mgnify:FL=1